jgi:hypothetical protein
MEVVLLWLDDLVDLLFCVALGWERLRRLCLQIGLAAAFALVAAEGSMSASEWGPTLAGCAGTSIAIWSLGAVFVALSRMLRRFTSATA